MSELPLGRIKLPGVRLSFPQLFKPKGMANDPNSTPKFSASFLMDKNTRQGKANIKLIEATIAEVVAAKWPKGAPKIKADKICLRDGDDESWDGYEGQMCLTASNAKRPKVVDRDKTPLTAEDGKPYGGCWVIAHVTIWAMDNEYGKRVNASLEAVQFMKDGEAFGARGVDDDDLDDLDDDDDGDDDEPAPRRSSKPASKRQDDDEDDEPAPRKKPASKRPVDDDEDDEPAPRKKRPAVEDDEDDEPAPRRSSKPAARRPRDDDEEDDEPAPRKKPASRRPRDDDDDDLL